MRIFFSMAMYKRCNPNIQNLPISLLEYSLCLIYYWVFYWTIYNNSTPNRNVEVLMRLCILEVELITYFTDLQKKYCTFDELEIEFSNILSLNLAGCWLWEGSACKCLSHHRLLVYSFSSSKSKLWDCQYNLIINDWKIQTTFSHNNTNFHAMKRN